MQKVYVSDGADANHRGLAGILEVSPGFQQYDGLVIQGKGK